MKQSILPPATQQHIGVDEAGRGAWAGAFYAVAVRLRGDWSDQGLQDSKQLTPAVRSQLAQQIQASRQADVGIGIVSSTFIDRHGLTRAQTVTMHQAVIELCPLETEVIIVDGHINYLAELHAQSTAVIRADRQCPAVMAASIVAKYLRDLAMIELAAQHPQYGFERHKGYGTALHRRKLQEHGACELHRLSYQPLRRITKSSRAASASNTGCRSV